MVPPTDSTSPGAGRASSWEADIVLNDGGIAVLRPARDADRDGLVKFYEGVSEQSKYLRFFSAHPTLSDEDLDRWIDTDNYNRVTLVLLERECIIAVAGFEVLTNAPGPERVADVSFLVQDAHHGRGVANILLEHLAEVGRENHVDRFFAEMLPHNRAMVQVFSRAGYTVHPELSDGFIVVDFPIAASETSLEVTHRRELRAEANSIRRLLTPKSVAVVGDVAGLRAVIPQIVSANFAGQLHVLTAPGDEVNPSEQLAQLNSDIDLVVAEYRPDHVGEDVAAAAECHAGGIVFYARGTSPDMDAAQARELVATARAHGLRALGPASLGIINTSDSVRLNASPAPMPRAGSVGLFTQSAGVATVVLSQAIAHGCGISSFIAAGSFADITANDVIQYWADDDETEICMLSLDTVGNPRKFFRVLHRLALDKHVVIFIPSRALGSARHYDQDAVGKAGNVALDEVIRHTGSMVVSRRETMFTITQIIARQPLPRGIKVAVISNSPGLCQQMQRAAQRFELDPVMITASGEPTQALNDATRQALDDPDIDAVLCAVVEITDPLISTVRPQLESLAARTTTTPLIASFVGLNHSLGRNEPEPAREELGQLPVIETYSDALEALSHIISSEAYRAVARPTAQDTVATGNARAAEAVIDEILASDASGRSARADEVGQLLRSYDIDLCPEYSVGSLTDACEAAEDLDWNVVLRATSQTVRSRPELATVIRHIRDRDAMEDAWSTLESMGSDLGLSVDQLAPIVQKTLKPGPTLTIRAIEDRVLGPMVSVGIAGIASELLDDRSWATPPLRASDARAMLKNLRAYPLLEGYRGASGAHLDSLVELIMKVAALKDQCAAITSIELTPVISSPQDTIVAGAEIHVAALDSQRDPHARFLSTYQSR